MDYTYGIEFESPRPQEPEVQGTWELAGEDWVDLSPGDSF